MTIRRTLLISYLLVSLASVLLITLMIFAHLRDVLREEIEHKLEAQAITIMQQIDTTLFERMQNMASWSHLGVMQEIRTRDIDKRLSSFLYQLYTEYGGVYQQLYVVNQEEKIIAASHAGLIGKHIDKSVPWLETLLDTHLFRFAEPAAADHLTISIDIADSFQEQPLGRLYARFNWQEIIKLLDGSVSGKTLNAVYYTLLADSAGRAIATSSNLNEKVSSFQLLDKAWLKQDESGAFEHFSAFLEQPILLGYSRSKGYHSYTGLDWRILILQTSDFAFAPILKVWHVFLLFLCLTLFLGVIVSLWMSAKISKPITMLAKSTHDFMEGKPTKIQAVKASTEIIELNTQFATMISNLEQSRLDIERVAKLAVIGEMAASMAHEVRTPLGVLRSSAQILQRETELSDIGLEMTDFILSETARLNELVSTMLECARPRPPKFSLHPVQLIVEHVVELLRTKIDAKHIQLELRLETQASLLLCDRDQLIQVFLNLIINAIQHTDEGGRIIISSRCDDDMLEINVCDTGAGISDEHKQSVFDPFFTQRQEGIGLGLTVVQQIVLAHQGKIFITDHAVKGSCFHLQFPNKH